jgi:transcriptional regulator with XRE-family HTH domain
MQVRIRQIREQIKMTQAEAAKLSMIPLRTYLRYEAGEREPKSRALLAIAKALNSTVEELFRADDIK